MADRDKNNWEQCAKECEEFFNKDRYAGYIRVYPSHIHIDGRPTLKQLRGLIEILEKFEFPEE